MENEIEDLVGEVKCTDSQKSVATSNMYSMDFTDSSSDKHNSTGKETYVIECDESDDSEKYFQLHENQSIINLSDSAATPVVINCYVENNETSAEMIELAPKHPDKSTVAQESFTQTSKTIIELAEKEGLRKCMQCKTLETQTSHISMAENKKVEYKIQLSTAQTSLVQYDDSNSQTCTTGLKVISCNEESNIIDLSLDDVHLDIQIPTIVQKTEEHYSENTSEDKIVSDDVTIESIDESKEECYENNSIFDPSEKSESDIEVDSLMCNDCSDSNNYNPDNMSDTSEVPNSVDSDIDELYKKLSEKIYFNSNADRTSDPGLPRFNTLTPLTEEPAVKNENAVDLTPVGSNIVKKEDNDSDVLFINESGIKVKVLPNEDIVKSDFHKDAFKLPPLRTKQSCPVSPNLNFMFSGNLRDSNHLHLEGTQRDLLMGDRWEIGTKNLAAGESPLISDRNGLIPDTIKRSIQLPPIHGEGNVRPLLERNTLANQINPNMALKRGLISKTPECINIKDRITELKMKNNSKYCSQIKYSYSTSESHTSRSPSPDSPSLEDSRLGEVAERGGEALCQELLCRLRSNSWFEVSDTLEELPKVMEKFWGVIAENRIADLIRQVSCHVDSPRTQVARNACNTLAAILKNTNYTKKPDFFEAVTSLMVKTGSYSRPVRRAANVALDSIVCGVELSHAVTALCIHGTGHKNPLVRCAAARLLVVCCALAGGGRGLLRTRPPSAVCARRHALRSMAALLEDRNTDTRKYAERLYSMLRPLSNFEAFYLTDVEVEVAARQMKKYDQLLLCGPPKEHSGTELLVEDISAADYLDHLRTSRTSAESSVKTARLITTKFS